MTKGLQTWDNKGINVDKQPLSQLDVTVSIGWEQSPTVFVYPRGNSLITCLWFSYIFVAEEGELAWVMIHLYVQHVNITCLIDVGVFGLAVTQTQQRT